MGSSLIVHGSSMVEQTTVNRSVEGSNPSRGVPCNIYSISIDSLPVLYII